MAKRVYKYIDGELVQIEGPPEDEKNYDKKLLGEPMKDSPTVVIPQRHRSAG
jgi:hypothetical protein